MSRESSTERTYKKDLYRSTVDTTPQNSRKLLHAQSFSEKKGVSSFVSNYGGRLERSDTTYLQSTIDNSYVMKNENASQQGPVQMTFVDKDKWKDNVECIVCDRVFNKAKGVFTHHCRVCGKAVCGECSTKKVNENRVCDLCFLKSTKFLRAEERRKDVLKSKKATIEDYKSQLKREKDELNALMTKKLETEQKFKEERENQEASKSKLQNEKDKAQEVLQKKLESLSKVKESLQTDQYLLREHEGEYEEYKSKASALNLEISQKKNLYQSKKEEFYRLQQQKIKYESSPSFLDITQYNQGTDSIVSNSNFSIVSNNPGADGRISLSRDPIKI